MADSDPRDDSDRPEDAASHRLTRRSLLGRAAGMAATAALATALPGALPAAAATPQLLLATDMDDRPSRWHRGYIEHGGLPARPRAITEPSRTGQALRLKLLGGSEPYPNVMFQHTLGPAPWVQAVQLSTWFWFDPVLPGWDSRIQAIEFAVNLWHEDHLWPWEAQLRFVGTERDTPPAWYTWSGKDWAPLGMTQAIEGGRWHSLLLQGEVRHGKVRVVRLVCDDQAIDVGREFAPMVRKPSGEALTVHVQLDGNRAGDPYRVILDRTALLATRRAPW